MKVAFYTLGCKVNQYETDLMSEKFKKRGYDILSFDQSSDIYVINSCSVTNMSTRKTRQELSKAKKKGGIVVLAGCYAQEIEKDSLKNVDIIIGNEEKAQIVDIVEDYIKLKDKYSNIVKVSDISKVKRYTQEDSLTKGINVRESIKIEDGCDNFCSYCIIPYVRGRVRSRNLNDIVDEVKNLVKSGVREVVLVGIEIASYGKDLDEDISLIDVIEKLDEIEDLKRIRLGSLEPRVLTDSFIARLANVKKLCPHFHLSVQSLDNSVLKNMNRKYTVEYLFDRINVIRKYIKNVAFTCDIIVGFPGETKEQFNNTFNNAKKIGFYEMHIFKYSKRKWTKAANLENQIDGNIANARSKKMLELAKESKLNYMETFLNKRKEVLFESYKNGYLYGYTDNYIKVKVRGDKKLWGCLLETELDSIEGDLILGTI